MVKLLQKGYISFIFNLFSLQLYTHLEQYSSMLKKRPTNVFRHDF